MLVSMNTQTPNPNFGYFKFTPEATEFLQKKLTKNQIKEFKNIVECEKFNKRVEATISCFSDKLSAELRVYDDNNQRVNGDYYKDLGNQGFFSRIFGRYLNYLKNVSEESSAMRDKYNNAKEIAEAINKTLETPSANAEIAEAIDKTLETPSANA